MIESINTRKIAITQKVRELIKIKYNKPDATEIEINRLAHLFFIDCFIACLKHEKEYWEMEKVSDDFAVLDIVDTNEIIEAANSIFDDEMFDMISDMLYDNEEALEAVLTKEQMEDTIFE